MCITDNGKKNIGILKSGDVPFRVLIIDANLVCRTARDKDKACQEYRFKTVNECVVCLFHKSSVESKVADPKTEVLDQSMLGQKAVP